MKKLNIGDIMIGDWVRVQYIDPDTLRKIKKDYRVSQIREDFGVMCVWCEAYGSIGKFNNLEPILLTSDILKKNGFVKCNEDVDGAVQYEFGTLDFGVDVWIQKDGEPCLVGAWRKWNDQEVSYTMMQELPIYYVNELQHVFRLCGLDKDITVLE